MSYETLMYFHLLTIVPCVFIGAYLLIAKKGDKFHRNLGKLYMVLMVITSIITLWMPAHVGPQVIGHFGYIHLFSILTLWSVPRALYAVKNNDIPGHKRAMVLLYFGAIIIAGGFTFVPGRFLYEFFFS